MIINKQTFVIAGVCAIFFTTGCQAKFLERLNIHENGSAQEIQRITMDDQFYNIAIAQDQNAFSGNVNGWTVTYSSTDSGDHIVTRTREIDRHDIPSAFNINQANQSVDENKMTTTEYFVSKHITVHALVQPMITPGPDDSNPFYSMGKGMAESLISARLEVSSPGHLTSPNGEINPDGSIGWPLGLTSPTTIYFDDDIPSYGAWVIIGVAVGIIAVLGLIIGRRKKLLPLHGEPQISCQQEKTCDL
jgi:hypothetical protein